MASKKSLLVDGCVPAKTECPFRKRCAFAENQTCKHLGILHPVPFSCAAARVFDMLKLSEK